MAFEFKGAFFDSAKVIKAMNAADRRAQGKTAGYTRRVAKNSIKYAKNRKQTSAPGSPPLAHRADSFTRLTKKKGVPVRQASSPLKELIFYGYDTKTKSTVVGPAVFRRSKFAGVAPARLEKGLDGYKPRPFMVPALKATASKYPDFFKASLRAS